MFLPMRPQLPLKRERIRIILYSLKLINTDNHFFPFSDAIFCGRSRISLKSIFLSLTSIPKESSYEPAGSDAENDGANLLRYFSADATNSSNALLVDYITLNVPPRAFSNVPLQIWSL